MTRKYSRFCDPTVDFAFHRIFGSEQYKDATIGFINSMLPDRKIRDVEFLNVEIPGFTADDRKSCVDILCRGNDDSTFVIEMQVVKQTVFKQRTVLYASTLISHLAEKGDKWDYELKPTYVISVIDFNLNDTIPANCISHYVSRDLRKTKTNCRLIRKNGYFCFETLSLYQSSRVYSPVTRRLTLISTPRRLQI